MDNDCTPLTFRILRIAITIVGDKLVTLTSFFDASQSGLLADPIRCKIRPKTLRHPSSPLTCLRLKGGSVIMPIYVCRWETVRTFVSLAGLKLVSGTLRHSLVERPLPFETKTVVNRISVSFRRASSLGGKKYHISWCRRHQIQTHCPNYLQHQKQQKKTTNTNKNMPSSTHQTEQQQQYTTSTNSSTVVRLVVISDTHGHHELLADLLPPGDILIHCGDFCDRGSARHADKFFHWIFNLRGYKDKIVIDGNHDRNLKHSAAMDLRVLFDEKRTKQIMQMQQQEDENTDSPADVVGTTHFLQDETIQTRSGIRLYGASWQSCEMQDLSNLEQFSASSFVDVLLVHYVPSLTRGNIVNTIRRHNIPLTFGGHTHWRRGVATIDDNNSYVVVNAASLWPSSVGAVGVSPPVVIDYDIATKRVLSIDCEPHPKRMR